MPAAVITADVADYQMFTAAFLLVAVIMCIIKFDHEFKLCR